jgi:biotin transport system permease protein
LATLFGLGLVLAATTSTRALGMAIGKLFRPVLGRNAWQVALALALMVHYLPLAWSTLSTIRSSIALRCPDLGWRRRVLLLPQAGIRTLAQTTWSQTLAVAARGLDGPEAWDHPMPLSWRDAAGAAVMLAFAGLIAWL